jgi:hypothetical protein
MAPGQNVLAPSLAFQLPLGRMFNKQAKHAVNDGGRDSTCKKYHAGEVPTVSIWRRKRTRSDTVVAAVKRRKHHAK